MRRIKKNDDVIVRTGKDKGKTGKVVKVLDHSVIVEGLNQVVKTQKPNPSTGIQGGFIKKDMPIHISNVALYNPVTKKADKVGFKILEDGNKIRYFKSTNETLKA